MDPKELEDGRGFGYDTDTPMKHSPSGSQDANGAPLQQIPTNVTLTPQMYEQLFLSPQNKVHGELRRTFANPTPLGLLGFIIGLTPLSAELMGWRGSGGNGVATTTASIWYGGLLVILAGLGEWILGNTFSFIVYMGYGAHFLTYATTFIPWYNAIAAFSAEGQEGQVQFYASYGFYPVALAALSFIFLICSLRTNVVFVFIFIGATIGFGLAGGAYWQLANGNKELGMNLIVGVGGAFFGATMFAWYMFFALMMEIMEMPFPSLPIGDLSSTFKARKRS